MIFKLIFFLFILISHNVFGQEIIKGKAKIIDGDTIHIGKNKIRLHGIDAPEINQTCNINKVIWDCGKESRKKLKKLILNQKIQCEINGVDKYKRFISECFLNNESINKYMVREGWAIAYRYYSKIFVIDENFAKKNQLGIWQGNFIEPYLFRKNNK